MYIIVRDHQIIAAHDDQEVACEYIRDQKNSDQMQLLRVKKRKTRELEEIPALQDIYLVRYGDFYVPYGQYEAIKDISAQRDYDLKYCRDILFRLLEEDSVSRKDISAIKKTLKIVISEIESLDDNDYDDLEQIRKSYEERRGGI